MLALKRYQTSRSSTLDRAHIFPGRNSVHFLGCRLAAYSLRPLIYLTRTLKERLDREFHAPFAGSTLMTNLRLVIQYAKLDGLRVIASAGSDEKVEYLKSLGADVAFNYKTTSTREVLEKEGPIDVYVLHPSSRPGVLTAVLAVIGIMSAARRFRQQ